MPNWTIKEWIDVICEIVIALMALLTGIFDPLHIRPNSVPKPLLFLARWLPLRFPTLALLALAAAISFSFRGCPPAWIPIFSFAMPFVLAIVGIYFNYRTQSTLRIILFVLVAVASWFEYRERPVCVDVKIQAFDHLNGPSIGADGDTVTVSLFGETEIMKGWPNQPTATFKGGTAVFSGVRNTVKGQRIMLTPHVKGFQDKPQDKVVPDNYEIELFLQRNLAPTSTKKPEEVPGGVQPRHKRAFVMTVRLQIKSEKPADLRVNGKLTLTCEGRAYPAIPLKKGTARVEIAEGDVGKPAQIVPQVKGFKHDGMTVTILSTVVLQLDPIVIAVTRSGQAPNWTAGQSSTQTFLVTGGAPRYKWKITRKSFSDAKLTPQEPSSLSQLADLSGKPDKPGPASFSIQACDQDACSPETKYDFSVGSGEPIITCSQPPPYVKLGKSTLGVSATGGAPPYKWILPDGSTIDSGTLAGC